MGYSKFSIVTPNFNQEAYLEQTIDSVLSQNYDDLEYIIIDGGSTDGSVDIIKKYARHLKFWVSEPDKGMYDALNKGFGQSTGELMGWINSDDILLPGSLHNVQRVFSDVKSVDWLTGYKSFIDLNGALVNVRKQKRKSFINFLQLDYKWIQQESTFWRRSVWEKSGGIINEKLALAGDFDLWFRFFQHTKLYYVDIPFGAWRRREGQLSSARMEEYMKEVDMVVNSYTASNETKKNTDKARLYKYLHGFLNRTKFLRSDFVINKRRTSSQLDNIELRYSFEEEKFVISD